MSKQWYFQVMGAEIGPISPAELMDKVKHGQIQADTLIRHGPDGKWLPADRVKGLLPKPEAPPPSSLAAAAPTSSAAVPVAASSSPVTPPPTAANDDETTYHFTGEAAAAPQAAAPESESFEFFEFVGFRHAITPALDDVLVAHAHKHGLSITQVTRQALAKFLGRPELGEDKKPEPPEPASDADAGEEPH